MVPGIHFDNSFSPVVTDTSVRLVLGIGVYAMNLERKRVNLDTSTFTRIKKEDRKSTPETTRFTQMIGEERNHEFGARFGISTTMDSDNYWIIKVFDVEAAFLNAKPGVCLYIKVPEVMIKLGMISEEEAKETVYELMTTMYGNVDAALRFFIKYQDILLKMGLQQLKTDPCVFFKTNSRNEIVLLLATHVEETLTVGQKKDLDILLNEFERNLKIEQLGRLRKHLGL